MSGQRDEEQDTYQRAVRIHLLPKSCPPRASQSRRSMYEQWETLKSILSQRRSKETDTGTDCHSYRRLGVWTQATRQNDALMRRDRLRRDSNRLEASSSCDSVLQSGSAGVSREEMTEYSPSVKSSCHRWLADTPPQIAPSRSRLTICSCHSVATKAAWSEMSCRVWIGAGQRGARR